MSAGSVAMAETAAAQEARPAVVEDPVGGLLHDVEDAFDAPALPPDRVEAVVEVALLGVAEALHRQQLVPAPRGLAGRQDA
jgi:hypothetical protein